MEMKKIKMTLENTKNAIRTTDELHKIPEVN